MRRPNSYAGLHPLYAWNVAMLTLVDSRSSTSDRKGTNGSWKWSRSNRSSARTSRHWDRKRGEMVRVPIEPLEGTLKPRPIRMMSPSLERCSPWVLLMMRTSWPRALRCW